MLNEVLETSEKKVSQEPAIQVLEKLGYIPISESENKSKRTTLSDVILKDILEQKLSEINKYEYNGREYPFSANNIGQAAKDINIPLISGLISTNEKIYDLLTLGKSYQETMIDTSKKSHDIKYIDFEHPENNAFHVTEEFVVTRPNGRDAKPDIVLFINGIPIAVIECKSTVEPIEQGISQMLRNQKTEYIPQLFKFVQIVMAVNKNEAKYATCGTESKFWSVWNEKDKNWAEEKLKKVVKNREITCQDRALVSLFSPERILDIIKNYIIFEEGKKKICRYQQYFAVKSILERVEERDENGKRKGGVIWHTQGSGKSITMAYVTKQLLKQVDSKDAKVVVVTDRVDLDSQIHKTFNRLGIEAARAKTGQNLIQLIESSEVKIITTVINKFEAVVKSNVEVESKNVFILIDEAHRTQYGLINARMGDVFKNATYISFTGTPLMKKDKNTFRKFGGLIKPTYTIEEALKDKSIVPIIYEGRMVDQFVQKEALDEKLEIITRNLSSKQKELVERKWSNYEKVASTDQRIWKIALDIYNHYIDNLKDTGFNAMLACNKKIQAIKYYKEFEEIGGLKVAIVMSPPDEREGEDDIEDISNDEVKAFYHNMISGYKDQREYEDITKSKFVNGDIDILIVVDKLLTGFDAPRASVMYMDKNIQSHNLLQAIARVNRLYEGKDYGYILDYRGLFGKLNKALNMYKEAGMEDFLEEDLKEAVYVIDSQIEKLENAYKELNNIFKDIKNKQDMEAYEILLEDKQIRYEFYDKLCVFGSYLGMILSSNRAYYKLGLERIREYKNALKDYQRLRKTVKIRYSEGIDHREYDIKMQKLLDTYVSAKGMLKIVEPCNITEEDKFNKEHEQMKTIMAKATHIRTRLTRTFDEKMMENPPYYKKFSKRLEEVIEEYRNRRISEAQYLEKMEKLKQDFISGNSGIIYPENVKEDEERAIYGAIYEIINVHLHENCKLYEIGEISTNIKEAIEARIKRDWHYNEEVHNSIKRFIDETIYTYTEEKNIEISFEEIDQIIEDILAIAMIKY